MALKLLHYMIRSWWLSSKIAFEEDILELSKWLVFWHFYYRQWDGHMMIVSVLPTIFYNVFLFCLPKIHIQFTSIHVLFVGYDYR